MVLVGVQPQLMQVPPTSSDSTTAVFFPARPRAVDSGPPDWPAPITIASYMTVITVRSSLLDNLILHGGDHPDTCRHAGHPHPVRHHQSTWRRGPVSGLPDEPVPGPRHRLPDDGRFGRAP